ncbi:hypothetical protein BSKO_12718 [Bryopsis sp. KO-2023]|nr:hypothetical protein BSKO_12718 [Bryopsis sp. KO-2023]
MSCCEAVDDELLPGHRQQSNLAGSKAPRPQSDTPIWRQDRHLRQAHHWVDAPQSDTRLAPVQTKMTGTRSSVEQSAGSRQVSQKGSIRFGSVDASDTAFRVVDESANAAIDPPVQQGKKFLDTISSTPGKDPTIPPPHDAGKFPHSASNRWKSDRKRGAVGTYDSARSVTQQQSALNSRTARWVHETNSQSRQQDGDANAIPPARHAKITPNIVQKSQASSANIGCNKVSKLLQMSSLLKRMSCGGAIEQGLAECLHQGMDKRSNDRYNHKKKCHELAPISIPQPRMHRANVVDLAYGDRIPPRSPHGTALSDMWSSSDATDWTAFGKGDAPSISSGSSIRHQDGVDHHHSEASWRSTNLTSIRTKTDHDKSIDGGGGLSPSSSISLFRPRLVFDVRAMEQLKAAEAQNKKRFPLVEEDSVLSWTDSFDSHLRPSVGLVSRDLDGMHADKKKASRHPNVKKSVVSERGGGRVSGGRTMPEWLPKMEGGWKRVKPESDVIEALHIHQQTSNIRQRLQVKVSDKSFHYEVKAPGSQGVEFEVPLSGEINAQLVSDGKGGGTVVRSHLSMVNSGLTIMSEWGHRPRVVCEDSFKISDNGNTLSWQTCITKDGQASYCIRRVYRKA